MRRGVLSLALAAVALGAGAGAPAAQAKLRINGSTTVNPSGGPLCGDPVMATGLARIIEVADRIAAGQAGRGVGHAASGAGLQQNLLCLMEGEG